MKEIVRHMPWARNQSEREALLTREWLVTNGLGGYASGTVCGVATRRYHGLLVAALPAPLGRTIMLNQLREEVVRDDGSTVALPDDGPSGRDTEFRLEAGLPVWRLEADGLAIEKRLIIPHLQNTVYVSYRLAGGGE